MIVRATRAGRSWCRRRVAVHARRRPSLAVVFRLCAPRLVFSFARTPGSVLIFETWGRALCFFGSTAAACPNFLQAAARVVEIARALTSISSSARGHDDKRTFCGRPRPRNPREFPRSPLSCLEHLNQWTRCLRALSGSQRPTSAAPLQFWQSVHAAIAQNGLRTALLVARCSVGNSE